MKLPSFFSNRKQTHRADSSRGQFHPWRRTALCGAILAGAVLAPAAFGQVTPFVDYYKTNVSANTTPATNAVINLLSSYNDLWTTGTSWDNGSPTVLGAPVLRASMEYSRDVTLARTPAQELSAYITDRQHQSYTAANGLGSLAAAYRTGAGATTTVTTFGEIESGNGAGSTGSALGKVVTLVNTIRGSYSSTNPPKAAFNYPRPYRMNLDSQVIVTGTEPGGFPIYDSPVVVAPSLLGRRSSTPATDGGFPSGHTNAAYLAAYGYAYSVPERMAELLLNASAMGQDRIVAGMHSPLDVIGGRIEATALAAAILHDPANATLKAEARAQAQAYFAAQLASDSPVSQAEWVAGKNAFTARMTYGLPVVRATGVAATVPKGAEVLLETRFTYLDDAQRREVLRTTALESGHAVEDAEGWSRLNLYAASGGYGRFDGNVTVTFSGGKDYWRNDISGIGGLTKSGTGELALTGNNTFSGNVTVDDGTLVAGARSALGTGSVNVGDASLMIDSGTESALITGGLTLSSNSTLALTLASGLASEALTVNGATSLAGDLKVVFQAGFFSSPVENFSISLVDFLGGYSGSFSSVEVLGLGSGGSFSLNYGSNDLSLTVSAVPEPQTWCLLALGAIAFLLRAQRRAQRL